MENGGYRRTGPECCRSSCWPSGGLAEEQWPPTREATRRIVRAQPSTRVLILTTFGLDDYVYDALRAGASGFMLKDAPPACRSRDFGQVAAGWGKLHDVKGG